MRILSDLRPRGAGERGVGVPVVLFFALASVGVLMVVSAVVPTAYAVTGLTNLPVAFWIIALVLVVFVPGYVTMTKYTERGGALYSIVSMGFGPVIGAAAYYVAILAYLLLGVTLYGMFGVEMSDFLAAHCGVNSSWAGWALLAWGIVAVAGNFKAREVGFFLALLTCCELVISVLLSALGVIHSAPRGRFHALNPAGVAWAALGPALQIASLAFIGFELVAIFRREARRPERTVRRAAYLCVLGPAVIYTFASWSFEAHYGAQTVAVARAQGPGAFFAMGTELESTIGNMLLLTSLLAALIGYHHGWVRYVFVGAEAGLMPTLFLRTNRSGVAVNASRLHSALGLATIGATLVFGWDPQTQVFFIGGTAGGYGVLWLLATASAAEANFFRRYRCGESVWSSLIMPTSAALLVAAVVVSATFHYSLLIDVVRGSLTAKFFPSLFLLVAVCGAGWALALRKFAPARFNDLIRMSRPTSPAVGGVQAAVVAGGAA